MPAKAIIICGKLCVGKSTYAKKLCKEQNALLLSCDEVMLSLFKDCGDSHDENTQRVKNYLYSKSLEVMNLGINVVLDWGFWQEKDRRYAKDFFTRHDFDCELHYIEIDDTLWEKYISKRNKAVTDNSAKDYFVDEGLIAKMNDLFEAPDDSEIDIYYK